MARLPMNNNLPLHLGDTPCCCPLCGGNSITLVGFSEDFLDKVVLLNFLCSRCETIFNAKVRVIREKNGQIKFHLVERKAEIPYVVPSPYILGVDEAGRSRL